MLNVRDILALGTVLGPECFTYSVDRLTGRNIIIPAKFLEISDTFDTPKSEQHKNIRLYLTLKRGGAGWIGPDPL